mgnify:CR=1 FL=1
MTEWSPGTAPTTTYEQEAGMLPSDPGVADNISNLVERAEVAATNAETAETNAETAETNAETAQAAAETARTGAETAQTAAEAAQTAAETAETNAETAQTAAETAKTAAETAETNAETAETNAESAQAYAEEWANKAEDSLVSVAAGGDGSTEYSALHHAAKASASATAASSAQSAAESARDATLSAYDQFDDRYLGAKASDPTLDNDGNALIGGALYFNTTDELMKLYTGSVWQAAYASLSTSDTDDLAEGTTNLYYTDARANAAIDTRVNKTFVDALNVDADTLDGINSTGFATSAQGALADSALQSGDNISELTNDANYSTTTGTVTSVAATVPTGLTVSGSPVTTTGTIAIAYDTGYAIPTTASQTNWDTAYGWGDHASAGYADGTNEANWNTAYGWGDHSTAGYLVGSSNLSDLGSAATARTNLNVDEAGTALALSIALG